MSIKEYYKAFYDDYKTWFEDEPSVYEWAANEIFDLHTYDGALDERFVKKIIEICKAIADRKTYEYLEASDENYVNYILVCQMLRKNGWINWGTSIRGAWFEKYSDADHIQYYKGRCDIFGLEIDYSVPFSKENIMTLIEFIEEEAAENEPQ